MAWKNTPRTEAASTAKPERLGGGGVGKRKSDGGESAVSVFRSTRLIAIIRAGAIKNSKAPVYLSAWIFCLLLHLFPFYKAFYFTASAGPLYHHCFSFSAAEKLNALCFCQVSQMIWEVVEEDDSDPEIEMNGPVFLEGSHVACCI